MVALRAATTASLPDELKNGMIAAGMWQPSCPVPIERLSLVRIRYVDFAGVEHDDGQLVTLDVAAKFAAGFFDKLFDLRFPIDKIRSPHFYAGNDEASMADNNTSCFNYRPIEGTAITSIHSYGLAIDINPLQNPYVIFDEDNGTAKIYPPQGWSYLNRHNRKVGMVEDVVPQLAAEHGFSVWGGRWTTPLDYHHFQTPRGVAELLLEMPPDQGREFFRLSIEHRDRLPALMTPEKNAEFIEMYRAQPDSFLKAFASAAKDA